MLDTPPQSALPVQPEPQPLREWLFDEAVYGPDFVRCAARGALKVLVFAGRDITDPDL